MFSEPCRDKGGIKLAYVFISHSSRDMDISLKVCEALEQRGVTCWIAPRDVTPGSEWAEAISNAIMDAKVMLLIYSAHSAMSSQVTKELGLANKHRLTVIPYKIDNTDMRGSFDYYLTGCHWITADAGGDLHTDELYSAVVSAGNGENRVISADETNGDENKETDTIVSSVTEGNILCQREEQFTLTSLYEQVSSILTDSDDKEDLARFKSALQSMASPTAYMVLGECGVGKTSLLKALFSDIVEIHDEIQADICEYRWGEQEFVTPMKDGAQRVFITSDNMRGLSIIDTKGLNVMSADALTKARQLTALCSAVFVVFDACNVTSPKLWDMIEMFPKKNMVFLLTRSDCLSEERLLKNCDKVRAYMSESNVSAPVFTVSAVDETANPAVIPMNDVRKYIRDTLVGASPQLRKQEENVEACRKMLTELNASFEKRKKQYRADAKILQDINGSMDKYMLDHKAMINNLSNVLAGEINDDIDAYQDEIISKLDPIKIKERFKSKEDFEFYLNGVNDNYKKMMTDSVNAKVVNAIKKQLGDLEVVFKKSVGYFNTRPNIIDLNDKFYSTLSVDRSNMIASTRDTLVSTTDIYRTLYDASYEAFMAIWEEREKYDAKIKQANTISAAAGAAAVGGASAAIIAAAGASISMLAAAAIVAVGAVVGAIVIKNIAKAFFEPRFSAQMREATQEVISKFKDEVNKTRLDMIKSVTGQVTAIFEKELASADSCFTEFRISVNTDEKRIPEIEMKIEGINTLLAKIDRLMIA